MDFGRDLKRLISRDQKFSAWADPAALELLPLTALKREAAAAGLAAHQADAGERGAKLVVFTAMLREVARRTGEAEAVTKAAASAARAAREAAGPVLIAAKLEQALCARLCVELFADAEAADIAGDFLKAAENLGPASPELNGRRVALRAAFDAAAALSASDLDRAAQAAGELDTAVAALDAAVRDNGQGKAAAAALRCDRADFLIGFGLRLKDRSLLTRAEEDLTLLTRRLDPNYFPLTWARAEALRASALAALGDLDGDPNALAESVRILAAAGEQAGFDYSPMDRGRISHTLALSLSALAEAVEDEGLYDHALAAFDQAIAAFEPMRGVAQRAVAAHDRAACVARQAERGGDAAGLRRAEASFRLQLAAREQAVADPVNWAVVQLALGKIYVAQARVSPRRPPPPRAWVALAEAMEIFAERGLKTLAEAAKAGLEDLKQVGDD